MEGKEEAKKLRREMERKGRDGRKGGEEIEKGMNDERAVLLYQDVHCCVHGVGV